MFIIIIIIIIIVIIIIIIIVIGIFFTLRLLYCYFMCMSMLCYNLFSLFFTWVVFPTD